MTVPHGSVDRSEPVGVGRVRPAGWSPGTGTLFGAWIASAAIARLTGASAVILLLAAGLVAMTFEVVAGWRSARTTEVADVVAPTVANVGEGIELLVTIDAPTTVRSIERRRIALALPDGTVVSLHDEPTTARPTTSDAQPATHAVAIPARFETPGVVTELTVRVDVAGPGGLIWWTRVRTIVIDPVHVAPIARGPASRSNRPRRRRRVRSPRGAAITEARSTVYDHGDPVTGRTRCTGCRRCARTS
jgi:hypothetical protein